MDWQHEVWAEALWVERHKGEDGPRFAGRIADLALTGEAKGAARWKRIAAAFDELRH